MSRKRKTTDVLDRIEGALDLMNEAICNLRSEVGELRSAHDSDYEGDGEDEAGD